MVLYQTGVVQMKEPTIRSNLQLRVAGHPSAFEPGGRVEGEQGLFFSKITATLQVDWKWGLTALPGKGYEGARNAIGRLQGRDEKGGTVTPNL